MIIEKNEFVERIFGKKEKEISRGNGKSEFTLNFVNLYRSIFPTAVEVIGF